MNPTLYINKKHGAPDILMSWT